MDQRARDLVKLGDHLYGKKKTLDSLMQEQADNFYVERADFTRVRTLGEDMASHLMTSYPLMVRRDLQNAVSTMLRPTGEVWFEAQAMQEDIIVRDQNAKVYLEWCRDVMWRVMYDRKSNFIRASKEGDGDFVTFGQCVKQVVPRSDNIGINYRCWHLKDCAWAEGQDGDINTLHRKWNPTIRQLYDQFKNYNAPKAGRYGLDPKIKAELDKPDADPYREIACRHIVVPADQYEFKTRFPFVAVYIDVENEHVIEEVGCPTMGGYVIPRWVTVSGGWQYAFSPATICALPDARLIQAMARVLLEASEISVYPPSFAVENAIRGDINRYASGITWVDAKYAGKLSEAFYSPPVNGEGIKIGVEMQQDIRTLLSDAFFLNKLNLPTPDGKMTAYEVNQRVQEYIRNATPLFEPIEFEDNGRVCEETFSLIQRMGGFGRPQDVPQSLQGQDIQFTFKNPLTEAIGQDKLMKFSQTGQLIQQAMQLDPGISAEVDVRTAFRDTLDGIETPAKWIRSDKDADAIRQKIAQDQATADMAHQINTGALVAKNVGDAGQSLRAAAQPQPA